MAATAPARAPRTSPRAPGRAPAKRPKAAPRRTTRPRRGAASRAVTPPAGLIAAGVGRGGDFADSGLMQRLTRSRAWIGLLGVLLAGIVTVNVLSLSYTASGGRIASRSEALQLRNAELRSELTKQQAGPRVEAVAASNGMVVPGPSAITYLTAGDRYAQVAAHRIEQGILTSGASAPAEPAEPVVTTPDPVAETEAAAPETAPVAPETTVP